MARRLLMLVATLLVVTGVYSDRSASAADGDRTHVPTTFPVFAHYMDWAIVPGGWPTASIMPLRRDNPVGGYDSTNVEIIRQHNAEMQANGILPMVSWWERSSYAGDAFLDLYLSLPGPQIAILYEAVGPGRMTASGGRGVVHLSQSFGPPTTPYEVPQVSRSAMSAAVSAGGIDLGNPANAEMFISDMAHLQEKYFSRYPDRFYRVAGRPVVFIWISHAFEGPFEQTVARARERSSFFLVGSEFTTPWNMAKGHETVIRGMDAITSYGFYDPDRYGLDMDDRFLADYRRAISDWSSWLQKNSPQTQLILPMNFAYDETKIPGRHGYVFRSSYDAARTYAKIVREAMANPCGSGRVMPVAYLTSYNEHYEGTAIEPTEEYQDNYLRIIHDVFSVPQESSSVPLDGPRNECGDDTRGKDPISGE